MAERYLIASGNVSDPANWFGGNKPTIGDVAHSNGFTGTIDENITCDEITRRAGATAVAGGGFVIPAGAINGAANITSAPVAGATIAVSGSAEVAWVGSSTGGTVSNSRGVVVTDTATLQITGDIFAGNNVGRGGLRTMGGSHTTVIGTIIGGTFAFSRTVEADEESTLVVFGSPRGGDAITRPAIHIQNTAHVILVGNTEPNQGPSIHLRQSGNLTVFGTIFGSVAHAGPGVSSEAGWEGEIICHGPVLGGHSTGAVGMRVEASGSVHVGGGVVGGTADAAYGIQIVNDSAITVLGSAVGGAHPTAHGIVNQSSGTVRVGGQDITNPSGALGVSNPGGGDVTTEYLAEMEPAYLPDVRAAEGGKVLVTLLKNSVNASTLVTGTPTVEVFDFARASVFGDPKAMTLTDEVFSYQHPTNVMTPRKLYYARVAAVIDGEARDLIERPFVAQ